MLPSLSALHIEYRIQDNGLRWFSSIRHWRFSSLPGFWKWLRPEFKRGQISCPFQGSGRSRIMRFIGVLRNAAKTGDEYPNGDRVRGEREGERAGWATMKLIDEKEKFDPRVIFAQTCTPRVPIVRYLQRMHFAQQPSYERLLSYFPRIFALRRLY